MIDAVSFGLQTPGLLHRPDPQRLRRLDPQRAHSGRAQQCGWSGQRREPQHQRMDGWSHPAGNDWFELYNAGAQPVSLGGLFFTSDLSKKNLSPVPPLSFIGTGPHGYLLFQADNNPNAGADHVRFKLSKAGDAIGLFSPAGALISAVSVRRPGGGCFPGPFPGWRHKHRQFHRLGLSGRKQLPAVARVVVNELLTSRRSASGRCARALQFQRRLRLIGGWFLSNSQENLKKYRDSSGRQPCPGWLRRDLRKPIQLIRWLLHSIHFQLSSRRPGDPLRRRPRREPDRLSRRSQLSAPQPMASLLADIPTASARWILSP